MDHENVELLPPALIPISTTQTTMWGQVNNTDEAGTLNPFAISPEEEERRRMVTRHRAWMESVQHEYPNPEIPFRIGVYIRFFNQTSHEDYLEYHKKDFIATIGLCPNWTLVDFYVDYGQSAPNMENAPEWRRLIDDCFDGKVDLIITQKVSNVSRNPAEVTLCARLLAAQKRPIGIYFVNENIFTLASYYMADLHDEDFLPENPPPLPDVDEPRRLYD